MKKLVYVDPQSYRNLSMYDYSLLKGMKGYKIVYCCNKQYDGPGLENVEFRPIFTYRQDMNPLAKQMKESPLSEKKLRQLLQELYCVLEEIHSFFQKSFLFLHLFSK